ncbi:MAG: ammonia channel protein, partial [Rhodoferax sp.]
MKKLFASLILGLSLLAGDAAMAQAPAASAPAPAASASDAAQASAAPASAAATAAPAAVVASAPAAAASAAPAPVPNKGDVAWMIVATAFVIMMSIPGLALFYGGLVRSKNMLSVLMQVFVT